RQHSVQVVKADTPALPVGLPPLLGGDAIARHAYGRRSVSLDELELDQLPLGVLVVPIPGEGEAARRVHHHVLAVGAVVLAGLRDSLCVRPSITLVTTPASSSIRRCREIVGFETPRSPVTSATVAPPALSRSTMSRRSGCARALNGSLAILLTI